MYDSTVTYMLKEEDYMRFSFYMQFNFNFFYISDVPDVVHSDKLHSVTFAPDNFSCYIYLCIVCIIYQLYILFYIAGKDSSCNYQHFPEHGDIIWNMQWNGENMNIYLFMPYAYVYGITSLSYKCILYVLYNMNAQIYITTYCRDWDWEPSIHIQYKLKLGVHIYTLM